MALPAGCTGPGAAPVGAGSRADGGSVPEVIALGDPRDRPDRQAVPTASLTVEEPAEAAQRVSVLVESVGGRGRRAH